MFFLYRLSQACPRCVLFVVPILLCTAVPVHSYDGPQGISLKTAKERISKQQKGEIDKDEKLCGVNCLYLFLKLHGAAAKFSEIKGLVPIDEHGASLQSLSDASRKLGFRTSPIFCKPSDLSKLQLPAIAHLERMGDSKPFLHYVLITKVTDQGVDFFDPFTSGVRFHNRSNMGTVFSGYFIVAAPKPLLRPSMILATLGVSLIGFVLYRGVRSRDSQPSGGKLGSVSVLIVCCCFLSGCGARVDSSSPSAKGPAEKTSAMLIEAETTVVDLGQIRLNAEAVGEFSFRNQTSEPFQLRLGKAGCSCVSAELKASETLAPGEAGRLLLHFDTSQRFNAGKVEGCFTLFAGDCTVPLTFCVKGFVDGVVFPNGRYVIRAADHSRIPDFEFSVVTHSLQDFGITKITCATMGEVSQMISREQKRLDTDVVATNAPLAAKLSGLTIADPVYRANEMLHVRTVKIPMDLLRTPDADYSGRIIVDWTLDGKASQAVAELLIDGSDI